MSYYVSTMDHGRPHALVAGPFRQHGPALRMVDRARALAREKGNSRLHWLAWGTMRDKASHSKAGQWNEPLGLTLDPDGYVQEAAA